MKKVARPRVRPAELERLRKRLERPDILGFARSSLSGAGVSVRRISLAVEREGRYARFVWQAATLRAAFAFVDMQTRRVYIASAWNRRGRLLLPDVATPIPPLAPGLRQAAATARRRPALRLV